MIGDAKRGNLLNQGGPEKVIENVVDQAVIHAVFDNKDAVVAMLKDLVEADLGLSVVVSAYTGARRLQRLA